MRSTASVAKNIIPFNKCILETLLTTWVASGVASIFWGVAAATPCHPGSFATEYLTWPTSNIPDKPAYFGLGENVCEHGTSHMCSPLMWMCSFGLSSTNKTGLLERRWHSGKAGILRCAGPIALGHLQLRLWRVQRSRWLQWKHISNFVCFLTHYFYVMVIRDANPWFRLSHVIRLDPNYIKNCTCAAALYYQYAIVKVTYR